ncbi:molybdopterin-dependent oxidoreductase [Anaerolineales bacterium HSG24]|nr:molybdopterin-dependent oxidoreductase [Anaerolineales bacterium HSG24]
MTDSKKIIIPTLSRRHFMGLGAVAGGAALLNKFDLLQPSLKPNHQNPKSLYPPVDFDREVYTMCEMCVWRCGVKAKVKDGVVRKLDGNPFHPHSRGMLCPRGQAGVATLYDPDRLKYPLIRKGERGEGLWARASWEDALDYVASRMLEIKEQYGPEAMVFSSTHNLIQTQFENLLKAYGSPNYGTQRSLCFNAMITANLLTYGMEEPSRDYSQANYIILTGRNIMEAISNSETQSLVAAQARGAKLVVLDPRFTKTAAKADLWLPIKPGTDLAFHLALLNIIITENRYDAEFVAENTVGFEELKASVAGYTPEWAASKCEIPADTIRQVAREFAIAAPNAFAHPGWRTSNFLNAFQTARSIGALNAIIGNWDQPGGFFASSGHDGGVALGSVPQPPYPRVSAMRLDGVPWKYPLVPLKLGVFQEIRDAILTGEPYQARGWFIFRQNPVNSLPERHKTMAAMSQLDFIVTTDISMNDTAWFSDVVLPEATYLERFDPLHVLGNTVFIRQPVIEPLFESKPGLWIFKELGSRLGLADYFQYDDEEDYIRQQIAPLGITLEDLKQRGYYTAPTHQEKNGHEVYTFNTGSGKIELASEALRNSGFAAVPKWDAPITNDADQFYLLSGKVAQHTQFATHNNRLLHERTPDNPLWMNPIPAQQRNLQDGDMVWVESSGGKVKTPVHVTEKIRPDSVFMIPGFGHVSKGLTTAYGSGVSDSDLHVTYTDPISGSQALSQTTVKVYKAEEGS